VVNNFITYLALSAAFGKFGHCLIPSSFLRDSPFLYSIFSAFSFRRVPESILKSEWWKSLAFGRHCVQVSLAPPARAGVRYDESVFS
jgi:hypothetical protein